MGMDESEADFARELLKSFGEDRFYHAMLRHGSPRRAKLVYLSLGGTQDGWTRTCHELRLGGMGSAPDFDRAELQVGEAGELFSMVACTLSLHYKEYALRSPRLPPPIHARMVLDLQNEWTRKYADNLAKQERDA